MSERKIFIRGEKEVIDNALKNTLPFFLSMYKGYTTPEVLEKAYHEIRSSTSNKSTSVALPKMAQEISKSKATVSAKTLEIIDRVENKKPMDDTEVLPWERKEQKPEPTPLKEAVEPKEKGQQSKSERIKDLLLEGKTSSEITKILVSEGLKCYSSEIFNQRKKLGI